MIGLIKLLMLSALALVASQSMNAQKRPLWNSSAAGEYLDQRMAWWTTWQVAKRDHQTFCVSCHTVLPYALARPTLRGVLGEQASSPLEDKLIRNVIKRGKM